MKIHDERPVLFEKSPDCIWLDPHIQREMLRIHLDPASDAASRNPESIRITCDWINRQIPPGSRILDLGCGPGLYAGSLSADGHQVTGIDFNALSIEYARSHDPEIRFLEGDYIQNFPEGEFDAVILIYCDFGTHSDRDRETLLRNCRKALVPGGKLIFDVFTEKLVAERQESKHWEYAREGGFWAPDEYLLLSRQFHYPDNHAFASQYNLICGSEVRHFLVWERYFTRKEITSQLKQNGFCGITFTENLLQANNFTSSSEVFIIAE